MILLWQQKSMLAVAEIDIWTWIMTYKVGKPFMKGWFKHVCLYCNAMNTIVFTN